jgi:hydrogenase expression/formation protein HypD
VVVAGFEPLDILAAIVKLTDLIREKKAEVFNAYPRCVTAEGNKPAQAVLWKVFQPRPGKWRGIGEVPDGNLDLRPEWARLDARQRLKVDVSGVRDEAAAGLERECICGAIMLGLASPHDCPLFG